MKELLNKKLAIAGMMGGIVYEISDDFLFLDKNTSGTVPDAAWKTMGTWRFTLSAWIALFGTALLVCGFISLYRMVKETCGKGIRYFTLSGVIGLSGILLGHFNLGVISPLIYKAMMLEGISEEAFIRVNETISTYLSPLNIVIIVLVYTQLLVLIYGVFSGKFGVKKRIFLYVFGITIVVLVIKISALSLFEIYGAIGGGESLFEGMMYVIPYNYWKNSIFLTKTLKTEIS